MDIKTEKMPTPVKYIVTVDADDVNERKKAAYERVKSEIEVPGFRKGCVPQDVAETKIGVERLYKSMIDQIVRDIATLETSLVSTRDFKIFGDLKRKSTLTIEFVAEVKPTVKLVSLDKIKETEKLEATTISDVELKEKIDAEIKQSETIHDSTKEILENLDIALIDFEGVLDGETTPFKGGTAKNYQIRVNDLVNGRKQFIDNFEDQLVGMKINEVRQVNVTFPVDYHSKELSGKKVIFTVKLNAIKYKVAPDYNDSFAKSKGFDSIQAYEDNLKIRLLDEKQKKSIDTFKKVILSKIVDESEISPIPQVMIDKENDNEWEALLRRMGKTEGQLEKESKVTKESFIVNTTPRTIQVVKTSLVIEQIVKDFDIKATEDEVVAYTMRITNLLKFDSNREAKIKQDLLQNKIPYNSMYIGTVNEKAVEFLFNEMKS
jgi:trigger factor